MSKNCGLETFSPWDFLKHGGHEGSGYSAVWKVLNGCLFKLQASAAARCLGWQITHFILKHPWKKAASRALGLRHGLEVVMDGASDVTASRSRTPCVQTLQILKPWWRREKTQNDVRGQSGRRGASTSLGNISNLFLFYVWGGVLRGVGWVLVGLSGDAAIINRQSEGRASVHKSIAESSEIIGADFSPEGEDYLCSPVVRK